MKIYLDCYPCFLKQALQAGRFVTKDEEVLKDILDAVASTVPSIPKDATSPMIGAVIHRIVRDITGEDDPYRQVKAEKLSEAKKHYGAMLDHVRASADPLASAARLSIVGNIIDYALVQDFDIENEIFSMAGSGMGIDDTALFKEALANASSVLYLGDNVGETVFDKVLIEQIDAPVTYAVRGGPVLNDVTEEDAEASGLGEVSRILPSGSDAPGTLLDECSGEFLEAFNSADVILSKGQGNYESLSGTDRPIFFLLRAKCSVVAADLGVNRGDFVLKAANIQAPVGV
jgi:damage-control phosphatase, subfamily I